MGNVVGLFPHIQEVKWNVPDLSYIITFLEMSIMWYQTLWRIFPSSCQTVRYDDVIKWKNFPRYWSFVRGIHRSPVNSSHNDQWRGSLMFSLIFAWMKGWVQNRGAGDLGRHRAYYDVTVMSMCGIVHCETSSFNVCLVFIVLIRRWCNLWLSGITMKVINPNVQWNLFVTTTSIIRFSTCD